MVVGIVVIKCGNCMVPEIKQKRKGKRNKRRAEFLS